MPQATQDQINTQGRKKRRKHSIDKGNFEAIKCKDRKAKIHDWTQKAGRPKV